MAPVPCPERTGIACSLQCRLASPSLFAYLERRRAYPDHARPPLRASAYPSSSASDIRRTLPAAFVPRVRCIRLGPLVHSIDRHRIHVPDERERAEHRCAAENAAEIGSKAAYAADPCACTRTRTVRLGVCGQRPREEGERRWPKAVPKGMAGTVGRSDYDGIDW